MLTCNRRLIAGNAPPFYSVKNCKPPCPLWWLAQQS